MTDLGRLQPIHLQALYRPNNLDHLMLQKLFGAKSAALSMQGRLVFASLPALEQALDGSEEAYQRYFFALYHCSPDEDCALNERRKLVRAQYPEKVVEVGQRFVLVGEAAFQIVSAYFQGLAIQGSPDEFREYAKRRHEIIVRKHRSSQSLPVPIDLTEGQLSADSDLDFYACLALSNGQIFPQERGQ